MSTVELNSQEQNPYLTKAMPDEFPLLKKRQKTWFGRKRDMLVLFSLLFIFVILICAIFADQISPYRPEYQERGKGVAWQDPSATHWLGTDGLGRDFLSRLIHGARVTVVLAVGVTVFQLSIGLTLGVLSGFFGGWTDFIIMRVADLLYAFPGLLLIILVVSVVDTLPRILTAFIVITLISWPDVTRLTRAQVLSLKQREFVDSARVMGASSRHIIIKHLFPNFIRPIAALVPLGMALVILSESSLSFLGLGVQPPGASWGNMINEVGVHFRTSPWMILAPSMSLVFTVLSLNYVSDWLLDE
ncbi:ABC transporter permease [Candidatus Chlorohelix sp.]|uniref:ABC transporter permease n=1 Tax=Candidatus Chlorohelix sp. TaxID=3139201 RepID=UPI0030483702